MPQYEFNPENVCSQKIVVDVEGGKIKKLSIVRGCPGNTQGVCALCRDMDVDEVISRLEGIRCPGSKTKMTSCPNELAQGLKRLKEEGKI